MPRGSAPSTRQLTPEEQAALAAQGAPAPYAPTEPGMYEPAYTGPGVYADAPPAAIPTESGYTEPGMYAPPYEEPGVYAPYSPPVEPGMYEPHYYHPGYYTTRPASTYYGGQDDRPLFTGTERFGASPSRYGEGTRRDMVQVIDPKTGEMDYRAIPTGGTTIREGTKLPDSIDSGATSRGDVLGAMSGGVGSAQPTPIVTLGPTASQLGYRYQQGDTGVVMRPRLVGNTPMPVRRSDLAPATGDILAGLFGGGERKTSQPMPLPPGSRRDRNATRRRYR